MERGRRRLMRLMYTNCQSVMNKRAEMKAVVTDLNPDLVCLTECWTNETIDSGILTIDGYELLVRKDRSDTTKGRGGGILVYGRSGMVVWEVETDTEFCQAGGVQVKTEGDDTAIYVIYRSPNSSLVNDNKLIKWIESLVGNYVLVGDFNYPRIDWHNHTCDGKGSDFLEMIDRKFIAQHVKGSTHTSGNKLDLVLSSYENTVVDVSVEGRLGSSDHEILLATVELAIKVEVGGAKKRDWRKADFGQMREKLDLDWPRMLNEKNTNDMWVKIRDTIKEAMDCCIPWKVAKGGSRPIWMTKNILNLISRKKKLWKVYRESRAESDKNAYKNAEKKVKKYVKNAKNNYEKKIAKEGKTNPKQFYSYLKKEKSNKVRVGPLKNENGELVIDPKEQADLLNRNYVGVFTVPDNEDVEELPCLVEEEDKLVGVEYTEEKVIKVIDSLRREAGGGPDEIPPRVLKEVGQAIAKPLVMLFTKSLEEKKIPDEWRDSYVVPIFKGGSKFGPKNYRPVNLTISIMKVKEAMDREEIVGHIERHELLSMSQHGFLRGRSCVTNLIEFQNKLTKWLDDGMPFDVFWLDFAKAFDKVDHRRLMVKVQSFGIGGNLLEWIRDWLRGRRQRVVVEGCFSEWAEVLSSVVQGSVLGTLLFIMFINDIDEGARVWCRKFADDTKGAMIVEDEMDVQIMQNEIDKMVRWAEKWRMEFNVDKCKVMHVGRRNRRATYSMDGRDLEETEVEKDLGVLVADTLKPSLQCAKAAKKANAVLGQILRAFHFRNKLVLSKLFKSFVRPILEYAVAVWSPWTEADCLLLEKVQRRVVRMMCDVRGDTYEEKLKDCGLVLLVERRLRGDMIEVFKVMKGISRVKKEEWFEMVEEGQRNMRQNAEVEGGAVERRQDVIRKERFKLDVRKNFFTVRVADVWNRLPTHVKNASNVNMFKSRIDIYLKNNTLMSRQ